MRMAKACTYFVIIAILIKGSFEQNSSNTRQKTNANNKSTITYSDDDISIRMSMQQVLLQPVRGLVNGIHSDTYPVVMNMTPVTNVKTRQTSTTLCRLIEAPNHRPFRQLYKINHKIKEKRDWAAIAYRKSVIYKLQDMKKLQYALDMEVINDTLVVIFDDGEVIFYNKTQFTLKEVGRKQLSLQQSPRKLKQGKILCGGNYGLFVSAQQAILIKPDKQQVYYLKGYQETFNLYTSMLIKQKRLLFTAHGSYGILKYEISQNLQQMKKNGNYQLYSVQEFTNKENYLLVFDIVEITNITMKDNKNSQDPEKIVLAILDPIMGIFTVQIPSTQPDIIQKSKLSCQYSSMRMQNCRMMVVHNKKIYVSCPQVLGYDPVANTVDKNVIITTLPTQILSSQEDLTIISHSSFQTVQTCTGSSLKGYMDGLSFHHTVIFNDYYVSIDDLSIYVWQVKYPEYHLACKANSIFLGQNKFNFSLISVCDNHHNISIDQCCTQVYQAKLEIYDSTKGKHWLEIFGIISIMSVATLTVVLILMRNRKLRLTYLELNQQSQLQISQDNNPKMFATQEALAQNQQNKQAKIFKQLTIQMKQT